MDRSRTLDILQAYGVGFRTRRILANFWFNETCVVRQGGYYGRPFDMRRGCVIGDPVSPTIFNIVEDAVLRYWMQSVASTGQMRSLLDAHSIFYVDDGQAAGTNLPLLTYGFNLLRDLFSRIGFALNSSKTEKSMVCAPNALVTQLSTPAYKRRLGGQGNYDVRKRQMVECPQCQAHMQQRRLSAHLNEVHGVLFCTPATAPRTLTLTPTLTLAPLIAQFPSVNSHIRNDSTCDATLLSCTLWSVWPLYKIPTYYTVQLAPCT